MKLKSLHINSYRHLQNVGFDFTYPERHTNAGKPLDKICIIGQSATGKTSILELIKNNFSSLSNLKTVRHKFFADPYKLNFNGRIIYLSKAGLFEMNDEKIIKGENEYVSSSSGGEINKLLDELLKIIYVSSDLITKDAINIFNQNPVSISNELLSEKYSGLQKKHEALSYTYEFGQNGNEETWFSLLYKILDYRKRFTQLASELINKGALADTDRLRKQYAKWAETNENPLTAFADIANPVLKKLNLEIDLTNTEYPIPVKSHGGNEVIPAAGLSTGTKGLLLSMFPLYELNTSDAIILIDEPERSLFPDIQIEIIDIYKKLAPNAQIIVATHSPFIAAAFEPEERFILFFGENGNVTVRRGESPIGDDPNDMLTNDFDVDYYNEFGKAAYKRYVTLKQKIATEKELEKKKDMLVEMTELGNKYNF